MIIPWTYWIWWTLEVGISNIVWENTGDFEPFRMLIHCWCVFYGGWESSTSCNFRKHMQIEKAPANQENIFISLTAGAANAHNTTKLRILFAARFFVWLCCEHLQRMLSNWWRCFLNLQVFFLFAARWALSATIVLSLIVLTWIKML